MSGLYNVEMVLLIHKLNCELFGKHIHPNGFDVPCLMFKSSFANIVNLVQDKDHHQVNGINGLYQRHYANIPLYKVKCGSSYLWQVCSIEALTQSKILAQFRSGNTVL